MSFTTLSSLPDPTRGSNLLWWLLCSPVAAAVVGLAARLLRRNHTTITGADTEFNRRILLRCRSLASYRPTAWLPGAHLNTLFAAACRSNPGLAYKRVLLDVEDGGCIALDWHTVPRAGQPVLVLQHGLTGGSEERYVQWAVKTAYERLGVCCVVMNARGCSTSTLMTPQCFSAAWTTDYRATVQYVRRVVGESVPVFGLGYSLGAGILAKYCAEEGEDCALTAAVCCCASFDFAKSSALLDEWPNVLYNRILARSLVAFLKRHVHQFAGVSWLDVQRAFAARTIRQFDTATIVPMFQYSDVDAYYSDSSSGRLLHQAAIPMLLLNAADDPICCTNGVPLDVVRKRPNLLSVITPEGGHVAWCQGTWWPSRTTWDNDATCEYLSAILEEKGYNWSREHLVREEETHSQPLNIIPEAAATRPPATTRATSSFSIGTPNTPPSTAVPTGELLHGAPSN